jgi:hypothetical protein
MSSLNPKDRASFEKVEEIIARIAPEWKQQPNIMDIVPALKTRGGYVLEDTLVIGFHVSEKLSPELLEDRGYQPIPDEIEGVATDVILSRRRPHDGSVDEKNTRSQMFDTLVGGIAVGNANMNAYGTLGMTMLAVSDDRLVGVTNEHVLVFDVDGHVGDEVQQPRFYLNSEVSLDSASCCPNGQLHYRGVDNPIVDAAAAVFAAAALAAALSDEIDPNRRGQEATVPERHERTLKEVVSVDMDYPKIPFPGRPYEVGVKWKYERHTDRRVMDFAADEVQTNEHVIDTQQLLTDKHTYSRGETVTFLALLGAEPKQRDCDNYFVTAAALSPSHNRAYKIILKPFEFRGQSSLTHGTTNQIVNNDVVQRCFNYDKKQGGEVFTKPLNLEGMTYDPQGRRATFISFNAPPLHIGLRFPDQGIMVKFRYPVQRVSVELMVEGRDVEVKAFSNTAVVGHATASRGGAPVRVDLAATSIDHLFISGGSNESFLLEICIAMKLSHFCLYMGKLQLAPHEELGQWKTYLFAQTRNNVPLGTKPTEAAKTIGGLPVTNNFTDAGESDNITYGHVCNIELVPDGNFEVVSGSVIE